MSECSEERLIPSVHIRFVQSLNQVQIQIATGYVTQATAHILPQNINKTAVDVIHNQSQFALPLYAGQLSLDNTQATTMFKNLLWAFEFHEYVFVLLTELDGDVFEMGDKTCEASRRSFCSACLSCAK